MVGGTVIAVEAEQGTIRVECGSSVSSNKASIRIADSELSRKIAKGDVIWWQSNKVRWSSTKYGNHILNKIGQANCMAV